VLVGEMEQLVDARTGKSDTGDNMNQESEKNK